MPWNREKIETLIEEIRKKAVIDEDFRKKLLSNPKECIQNLANEEIPENFQIQIVEKDPSAHITLVIPPLLKDELSESELEQVSGGGFGGVLVACIGVGGCLAEVDWKNIPCAVEGCAAQASGGK